MKQTLLGDAVVVDSSEPRNIIAMLSERVPIVVRRLDVGDYIVGSIAIERKTFQDMESSIVDGRVFRQTEELARSYEKAVLLLEGSGEARLGVKINAAVAARLITKGITLISTANTLETVELIASLYKKVHEQESPKLSIGKKPKGLEEQKVFVLSSFPGIGKKRAEELLKRFRNIKSIAEAAEDEIASVRGIGKKRAKAIKEVLCK